MATKKKETEFLTEEEAQAMLRVPDRRTVQGKRDYAILLTLLTTGLRKAELCGLKVGDLKTYRNQPVIDVIGKGQKFRCIPIHSDTLLAIKDYLEATGNGTDPGDRLFRTLGKHGPYEARPLTAKAVDCLIKSVVKKALIHEFLRFLEQIGQERMASFSTEDFLVIDFVHREQPVPDFLKPRIQNLSEQGVIEQVGRGRGTRYLLSRRFYRFLGKSGVYTRKRGLDRETNKMLLLRHIEECGKKGSPVSELQQVLPMLSRRSVQRLVEELEGEGKISGRGKTRARLWYSMAFVPK